jgi:hypothetical protein
MSDLKFNLFCSKGVEAAVIVASTTPSTAEIEEAADQTCYARDYFLTQHGHMWMTEKFLGTLHIMFIANEKLNDQALTSLFSSLPPEAFPVPSKNSLQP